MEDSLQRLFRLYAAREELAAFLQQAQREFERIGDEVEAMEPDCSAREEHGFRNGTISTWEDVRRKKSSQYVAKREQEQTLRRVRKLKRITSMAKTRTERRIRQEREAGHAVLEQRKKKRELTVKERAERAKMALKLLRGGLDAKQPNSRRDGDGRCYLRRSELEGIVSILKRQGCHAVLFDVAKCLVVECGRVCRAYVWLAKWRGKGESTLCIDSIHVFASHENVTSRMCRSQYAVFQVLTERACGVFKAFLQRYSKNAALLHLICWLLQTAKAWSNNAKITFDERSHAYLPSCITRVGQGSASL